jgi:EF-P beta-lysylation protein EpmB
MKIVATQTPSVAATMPQWRQEMKRAIRDPSVLVSTLGLGSDVFSHDASQAFSLFAPLPFVRRIQPGQPQDPLLLQLLPQAQELQEVSGFSSDPVQDGVASQGNGVIQKYPGRVLLVLTGACAIHCRYCFRREYPYAENQAWRKYWPSACDHIKADPSLKEVILSGGDPLTLDDEAWQEILEDLAAIEHLQRIRIHSRLPIMIPSRVTSKWLQLIAANRLKTVFVIHANHSAELDAEVAASLQEASQVATLLNQSVLLRGVNDSVAAQQELAERLLECRVIPYYLNLLDRVSGAAHFEVAERDGIRLLQQLRQRLPGYLVPRLVRDEGHGLSKRIVA